MKIERFRAYIEEAARVPDIVEIAVSTRPDCIRGEYLEALKETATAGGQRVTVELGLQTANYHTLQKSSGDILWLNLSMLFLKSKNTVLISAPM